MTATRSDFDSQKLSNQYFVSTNGNCTSKTNSAQPMATTSGDSVTRSEVNALSIGSSSTKNCLLLPEGHNKRSSCVCEWTGID